MAHILQEILNETIDENIRLHKLIQKISCYHIMTNQKEHYEAWAKIHGEDYERFFDDNYGKSSTEQWINNFDKWLDARLTKK